MTRYRWIVAVKIAIGVVLVGVVWRSLDSASLIAALAGARASMFAAACLLLCVGVALNAARWRLVMRELGHELSAKSAAFASFESMFFQQLLPAGVGGDIARGVRAYDSGIPATPAALSVVIDRGLGLLFVAESLIVSRFVVRSALIGDRAFAVLLALAVIVVVGAATAVAIGAGVESLPLPKWLSPLGLLTGRFSGCMRSSGFVARTQAVLVASNAANITAFYFCARALDVDIGWGDGLIVVQGLVLASLIPVSIGGWGVRESAALVLFAPLGVDRAHAVAVSVLYGLVLTTLAALGAGMWLTSGYRRVRMRSACQDEAIGVPAPGSAEALAAGETQA